MSGRLAGKRVVVVGAGTREADDPALPPGNGRAISVLAAREGASVVCVDVDESSARETQRLIEAEGGRAAVVVADVGDPAACAALVADSAAWGAPHGLVLNVGISLGDGIAGTSLEDWDRTFDVDVRSHFLIVRAALPVLEDGASIVFCSSTSALLAFSSRPAYDASKAALRGLCRHVAMEAGPRVRANEVVIGSIDTPLSRAYRRELAAGTSGISPSSWLIPLDRRGTAWEVAAAVAFLLCDDASYVSGQALAVDGGFSAAK